MRGAVAAGIVLGLTLALPAGARVQIEWSMLDRFRVIEPGHQQRFNRDYRAYLKLAGCRRWDDPRTWGCPQFAALTHLDYPTYWKSAAAQYEPSYVHSRERRIALTVKGAPPATTCRWTIDGRTLPGQSCARTETMELGRHVVRVDLYAGGDRIDGDEETVHPLDVLVVSLGDSFGSGEGNPHLMSVIEGRGVRPALWWDRRCHRSLVSGPALAAWYYAEQNERRSVTFLSYACSGAEIGLGILAPYWGRETSKQVENSFARLGLAVPESQRPFPELMIPAQIDQAAGALCPSSGTCRVPDFVLVSTGGNEVRFGDLVVDLNLPCDAACQARLRARITDDLARLPAQFDRLGLAMRDRFAPKTVIITQYPDPTHDEKGRLCDDGRWAALRPTFLPRALAAVGSLMGVGITAGDAGFAYEQIHQPLNAIVRDAAHRHRWKIDRGVDRDSRTKGYCSRTRWFNHYREAVIRQGELLPITFEAPPHGRQDMKGISTGAMHPNVFGHNNYALRIVEQMN